MLWVRNLEAACLGGSSLVFHEVAVKMSVQTSVTWRLKCHWVIHFEGGSLRQLPRWCYACQAASVPLCMGFSVGGLPPRDGGKKEREQGSSYNLSVVLPVTVQVTSTTLFG